MYGQKHDIQLGHQFASQHLILTLTADFSSSRRSNILDSAAAIAITLIIAAEIRVGVAVLGGSCEEECCQKQKPPKHR